MRETSLFRSSQQHLELINIFEPLSMAPLTQESLYLVHSEEKYSPPIFTNVGEESGVVWQQWNGGKAGKVEPPPSHRNSVRWCAYFLHGFLPWVG